MLLAGILILYLHVGSFSFLESAAAIESGKIIFAVLMATSLLIFAGAIGKSAQFPLQIWLPDAMEGPSTVSALIHAATMVKAGVYLTARTFILFGGVPEWLNTVLYIGAITALIAATMALVSVDIKRVLAYSTISQLGFMITALGIGTQFGWFASQFHVMSHALFKALLFLAAGSVMHAVGTTDMREMGGLRKYCSNSMYCSLWF
jgi:NADH-quinone oxidoreductase subunit L